MDPTQRAADYKAVYEKLWASTYGDFLFENPSFNVQANSVTGADQRAALDRLGPGLGR